jgi:hypothetical protein
MINVQNKFIKIKNGNNEVVVHNYIFDKYLEYINSSQFLDENFLSNNSLKRIDFCFIKLDEPIRNIDNMVYTDFDLCIRNKHRKTVGNKNGCNTTYNFDSAYSLTTAEGMGYRDRIDISEYKNRKIVALGFFNFSREVLAYVDTSDFNINIIEDQSIIVIREDECSSNMECVGIEFPYHLLPTEKYYKQQISETGYIGTQIHARLYSIGYGISKGIMSEEYKLDNNEVQINKTETNFSFSIKTGDKTTSYPRNSIHPSNKKYPVTYYIKKELYPSTNNYTSNAKYPLRSNVKYIIYKYELITYDTNDNIIHLNKFYTMNYASSYIGLCEVRTKIERRN